MNQMKRAAMLIGLVLSLGGCWKDTPMPGNFLTPLGGDTPKLRWMELGKEQGTIYAWDTGSNVAYTNKIGNTCFVAASLAKGSKFGVDVDVIAKLGVGAEYATQLLKLQEKDAPVTMLDIGMFHACVLNSNGVSQDEIIAYVKELGATIKTVYPDKGQSATDNQSGDADQNGGKNPGTLLDKLPVDLLGNTLSDAQKIILSTAGKAITVIQADAQENSKSATKSIEKITKKTLATVDELKD